MISDLLNIEKIHLKIFKLEIYTYLDYKQQ